MSELAIDTSFDFRSDARGKDPDSHSPTLRRYHQMLWSKPLPSGIPFELDATTPEVYLHHRSDLGEFFLSSDSIITTFTRWKRMADIVGHYSESENDAFRGLSYTIGGMMVLPSNQVNNLPTLNGARGLTRSIADRMDLSLECIRLFYLGQESPLGATLERYREFFHLFGDFAGYVEFFLHQDLVEPDFSRVQFLHPFTDFDSNAVPSDLESYRAYRAQTIEFIHARNRRIGEWATGALA
ncbi:hypothetical protein [Ferrimicrobium sp.]|uniref:DUF6994 family protein n=1 Tax=Ferrimicrobium sp. TaxID=2926050 RepID=UPI0026272F6F|nr:hypothetical protein [Ferrimicrobium sp.]